MGQRGRRLDRGLVVRALADPRPEGRPSTGPACHSSTSNAPSVGASSVGSAGAVVVAVAGGTAPASAPVPSTSRPTVSPPSRSSGVTVSMAVATVSCTGGRTPTTPAPATTTSAAPAPARPGPRRRRTGTWRSVRGRTWRGDPGSGSGCRATAASRRSGRPGGRAGLVGEKTGRQQLGESGVWAARLGRRRPDGPGEGRQGGSPVRDGTAAGRPRRRPRRHGRRLLGISPRHRRAAAKGFAPAPPVRRSSRVPRAAPSPAPALEGLHEAVGRPMTWATWSTVRSPSTRRRHNRALVVRQQGAQPVDVLRAEPGEGVVLDVPPTCPARGASSATWGRRLRRRQSSTSRRWAIVNTHARSAASSPGSRPDR